MHEVDFRSPRDELTSDDYSSSDDDSQPSTSEYSPDRSHQQSAVPPAASERQGGSAHQHRPAVPMLGLKMPAQSQQEVQPPSLPAATRQHPPADTETNAASSSAPVPSLQLPRSFSRGTDNSRDASAPSRSMSRVQSQRKSSRHSPRPLYTIQLASDALTMDAATLQRPQFREMSSLEAVKHHCATELGIKQSAIRLYQLHEVTELTDSSLQLAIAVEGSGQLCAPRDANAHAHAISC